MTGVERCCVVIGGRGFAVRHLVEMLIRSGNWVVRIADLGPTIKLEPDESEGILGEALRSGNARYVSGDLRDKTQVLKVCQGAEVVFHMAAPDSSINNHQLHYSVNVEGTKNVIDACIECKVKRLIYTSTIDVVFDGVHGISNGDESMPYPAKHNNSYAATKAEGEALVIKYNGKGGLLTCCIRPSCIFGPGDRLLVPSVVASARAGKNKFIIGDGNNMFDFIYVENVAYAHICAEKALASESVVAEKAAGQVLNHILTNKIPFPVSIQVLGQMNIFTNFLVLAYFITNKEPIKFWEFISLVLEGLGYERPRIKIPATVMMPIAHVVEWTYTMLAHYGMGVPQLTPSRMRDLTGNKTFNCSKAKDQLGYTPLVSLQEGLKRTIESYSHLKAEHQPKREGPSKSYRYLGSGKVADTLLWKDKKQTITTVLVLIAFYCYFIASGYTIITAISKLLMVTTIFLFVHGILPAKIFGYSIEKIPASSFHLPEERCRSSALMAGSLLNSAVHDLKSLCKGKGWTLFFKVFIFLSSLSFLGATSIRSIFLIGMPFAFFAFMVYEMKEKEIDGLVHRALSSGQKLKSDITGKFL